MKTLILFVLLTFPIGLLSVFSCQAQDASVWEGAIYACQAEAIFDSEKSDNDDLKRAIDYFELAEKNGFGDAYMYYIKGSCYYYMKDHAKAIATLTKGIELLGDDTQFVRHDIARKRNDKYEKISTSLFEPPICNMFIYRGESKRFLKDNRSAEKDFDKAELMCPDRLGGMFLMMRGLTRIALGKLTAGCDDFSRAGEMGNEQAYVLIQQHCN